MNPHQEQTKGKMETQETVREAAKAEMGVDYEPHMSQTDYSFIQGAEFGANWQKEHSYSEQEVIKIIENFRQRCIDDIGHGSDMLDILSIMQLPFDDLLKK